MSHHRLHDLFRRLTRRPKLSDKVIEGLARVGYGARGFVYLSAGVLTLLAATDDVDEAAGSREAIGWLAQQPFGKLWLVLLGLGLMAFVAWSLVQSLLDADREGNDLRGLAVRLGQFSNAVFHAVLAFTVFQYLHAFGGAAAEAAEHAAQNRDRVERLLALPMGQWLLVGAGLTILAVGVTNMVRAARDDFTGCLACSDRLCRRLAPLARVGYAALGFAYLPLAAFVVLAGLRARPGAVTSLGEALDALEKQPGGSWMLGLTAVGLMAFGAFAFVEARWRKIRAPRG
ncbi:DUF1206 domain-containing protein [uncultured Brevundimonas sp.]|uniref:DUF1206 domain-containing protein n=1 Tax=uncultured Brevundimonas sp. TaxID=213418 RepID=UPI0030EBC230|tara:strand:- start:94679 stop:95539 length:861 start_codon:yes stop_codon:yes gene_type:complete